MLTVISAGIAPGLALLSYFYLKDQYDAEPIGMVLRSFILGALLVFPVLVIQYAFHAEGLLTDPLTDAFFLSGLLEEFLKWFILFYTVYQHVVFNEHYDGIVYGTATSLGFASAENILFLIANGMDSALVRAILPVSSHGLFGVLMGYYLGKGKFSQYGGKAKYLLLSLAVPVFFHGFYNFILHQSNDGWIYAIVPFMIVLWYIGLRKVKLAHQKKSHLLKKKSLESES